MVGAARLQSDAAFEEAQRLSLQVVQLMATGKYFDAIPLAVKARDILERELPESVGFAGSLKNLAELYRYTEQYEKAEPLYVRSLKVWRQMRREESYQYGL
ncbi:MAG TPA: tetratricopeptide repeat protein, partial [Allosphingosinicella sp.]|nr:tetratricopeptide repeat protein [Allosphingosinicella sp.]